MPSNRKALMAGTVLVYFGPDINWVCENFREKALLCMASIPEVENEVLRILYEQDVAMKKAPSRLVIVYDGEKKFTTTPLDAAIKGYATFEGDAIVVVAFLEHILSPSESHFFSSSFYALCWPSCLNKFFCWL